MVLAPITSASRHIGRNDTGTAERADSNRLVCGANTAHAIGR
jgi:hypothetical protein